MPFPCRKTAFLMEMLFFIGKLSIASLELEQLKEQSL